MKTASLHAVTVVLAVAYLPEPARADTNVDPVGSPPWPMIRQEVSGTARTMFSSRIRITEPAFAEDAMRMPITFDASALGEMERIVVTIDRSPTRKVLEFAPMHVRSTLLFQFKLQEASAVHVAAHTPDGVWHIGILQVDATDSDCMLPGATRQNATWSTTLNQVESRVFPDSNGADSRTRLCVMCPMGIGLVADILSFHIEQLNLFGVRCQPMPELALYEPVTENPIFSLDLDDPAGRGVSVAGVGNNGNRIRAQVTR